MSLQMPLLIVVMVITGMYSYGRKTWNRKWQCVAAVTVILALFSGLRSWWMGDLIKYYTLYRRCAGPEWAAIVAEDASNQGIRYFFHYASVLGISYDDCILIIAIFVAVTLGMLVYRYSPSPYWSYVMYLGMGFYHFTYSGLKQSIAMGFLILACMAMFERKPVKFLAWVLVGSWFHAPSLIFLAAYPFCRQRVNGRYFALLVVLFAVVFLFRGRLVTFLSTLYYDEQETYAETTEVGGRFLMMLLILGLGYFLRPLKNWDRIYVQVFNLMAFAAFLQMLSVFGNNFTRLTDYYYQFVVLFMPMILEPGHSQVRSLPQHREKVRYYDPNLYVLLGMGITLFAIWYYGVLVDGSWAILKDFKFRWEIDPYSLYGN